MPVTCELEGTRIKERRERGGMNEDTAGLGGQEGRERQEKRDKERDSASDNRLQTGLEAAAELAGVGQRS